MHVQVLRCLNVRHTSILDQAHRLKLELPRKLTPLHDPPPAPSKHLTRCLRNRVQATWRDSSCPAASLEAGIDARGTRGDFQRRYDTSIGTIDRQVSWPLTLDGEPGNGPQWRP